jgi:pimeloyl-ACP methyl ester carboxylesterase
VLGDVRRRVVELPERGVDLALLDWGGDGPLALLAHANGFCAALWDGVARVLRGRFRVIAYDARGHGDSSKPPAPGGYGWDEFRTDAIALAERLCTERGNAPAYAIGHSFGGTAMLGAASQRPDLFARLAMLDPVLYLADQEHTPERIERKNLMQETARRRRVVWPSREAVRRAWSERDLFAGWDPRAFDLYLAEGFRDLDDGQVALKCPGEIEGAIFGSSGRADLLDLAANLRVPGLLLFAGRGHFDRSVPEKLAAAAPELRLEDLPFGHLMLMEAPEAVGERLLRFAADG